MRPFSTAYQGHHLWLELSSGARFILDRPPFFESPPDLLLDICLPLSRLRRFTGHGRCPWSVAKHTLVTLKYALLRGYPVTDRLDVLLHDAAEAIVGDIASPLKGYLFDDDGKDRLRIVETVVDCALRKVLKAPNHWTATGALKSDIRSKAVADADMAALAAEAVESMPSAGHGWPSLKDIDLTGTELVNLCDYARSLRDGEEMALALSSAILDVISESKNLTLVKRKEHE